MTANNRAKRKRTKKSGVFKRLEERELKRDIEALIKIADPVFDVAPTRFVAFIDEITEFNENHFLHLLNRITLNLG